MKNFILLTLPVVIMLGLLSSVKGLGDKVYYLFHDEPTYVVTVFNGDWTIHDTFMGNSIDFEGEYGYCYDVDVYEYVQFKGAYMIEKYERTDKEAVKEEMQIIDEKN